MSRLTKNLGVTSLIVLFCIAIVTTLEWRGHSAGDVPDNTAFGCRMEINNYRISVRLLSTNSWLAEHNMHLSIFAPDGRLLAEEVFADPGGLTTMYFANDDEEIIAMDGRADALTLHKETQMAERENRRDVAQRLYSKPDATSAFLDGRYTCRLSEPS